MSGDSLKKTSFRYPAMGSGSRMRSLPGHLTPMPSPAKKVPKEVSMIPTTYLRTFSGTCVSGRRAATPTATTATTASAAPAAAE